MARDGERGGNRGLGLNMLNGDGLLCKVYGNDLCMMEPSGRLIN